MKYIERLNSPKRHKWSFCCTRLSIGYNKSYMDWKNGHFSVFQHYYFLFWTLQLSYSVIRFEKPIN